jgi:DnaA-homolog protein
VGIDSFSFFDCMRQLPLPIGFEATPSFETFAVGANALAVTYLQQAIGQTAPVFLWGEPGTGKSHLLQALAHQTQRQGARVSWFHPGVSLPWNFDEAAALIVFDNCDQLDAMQQHAAFQLFVEATTHGIVVLGAGRVPPVDLPVREDLRTRLGWGHVFALHALTEADVRAALRREADRRGLFLSDEVMTYLLTRFERDLKNLMQLLDRLDEFSLVHKRAITIPLLKQMLAESSP